MPFNSILPKKTPYFVALGLMAVLTSCGSFQYAGYDNDGIYSSEGYVEEKVVETSSDGSNYYKNYFSENKAQLEAITSDNEVFTDIDSYEGNYMERAQDTLEQKPIYGGWGQNNETVTINYIDNGWMGFNDPWLWNGGWGLGWNNWAWGPGWGWNAGWGLGWNNWGWGGPGWGWNAGWGIGWNNWGYNNGGWGNGWNNGYNGHGRYSFSGSRRGRALSNNTLSRRTANNAAISRNGYSTRRLANATTNTRRNTRGIDNGSNRVSRSTRSSNSMRATSNNRVTRPNRTVRNSSSTNYRVSSPSSTSRSSRSVRSTGTNSRSSSGNVRSSSRSSSSRSSATRSSSSRRGRG